MAVLRPEFPDMTRIEFEHWIDVYGAWRNDAEGARAGWPVGDGERNWMVYGGSSAPCTWVELAEQFSVEALNSAVRLNVHPDDVHLIAEWPTQKCRCPVTGPARRHFPCPVHGDSVGA